VFVALGGCAVALSCAPPATMQDVSVFAPTVRTSVAPPCRPCASTMTKTRFVVAVALAIQDVVSPVPGIVKNEPPGTIAKTVMGCTAAGYALNT
jgi:hypothetical protein